MKQNKLPPVWNEERMQRVLAHYNCQTDEEAIVEKEAYVEREEPQDMIKILYADGLTLQEHIVKKLPITFFKSLSLDKYK
jgi:hypothetical protein